MQKMLDTTLEAALAAGCDTVQLKPKGISRQFCVADGKATSFSRFKLTPEDTFAVSSPKVNCTLLGASMLNPLRCYIYDCWCVEGTEGIADLRNEAYRSRHVAAKIQVQLLGEPFHLVQNFPIAFARNLWGTLSPTSEFNGLIYRNSKEDTFAPVRVSRWYAEMPRELV